MKNDAGEERSGGVGVETGANAGLKYSSEYKVMNGSAHRKPPSTLGAPSLSRHIGLWMPRTPDETETASPPDGSAIKRQSGEQPDYMARYRRWVRAIDAMLAAIFAAAYPDIRNAALGSVDAGYSFQNGVLDLFEHRVDFANAATLQSKRRTERRLRHGAVSFLVPFQGVRLKLRASLHSEYVEINLAAELYLPCVGGSAQRDFDQAFKSLERVVKRRWDKGPSESATPPDVLRAQGNPVKRAVYQDRIDVQSASEFLYKSFWDAFDAQYLRASIVDNCFFSPDGKLEIEPGAIFADLRGVCLLVDIIQPKEAPHSFLKIEPLFADPPLPRLLPYTNLHRYTEQQHIELIDAFLPFLQAPDIDAVGRVRRGDSELAACRMINSRFAYVSSLGSQSANRLNAGNEPLRFLIVTNQAHRYQVGRLIERLNTLGVVRLASLKDLRNLVEADRRFRVINDNIDQLEALQNTDLRQSDIDKLYNSLDHAGDFEDDARVTVAADGGLNHRIDRSKYYVSQFKELAAELRAERIEGYQTYEEFVVRRIGATWEFIARTGRTMAATRQRIDGLVAQLSAAYTISLASTANIFAAAAVAAALVPMPAPYGFQAAKLSLALLLGAYAFVGLCLNFGNWVLAYIRRRRDAPRDFVTFPFEEKTQRDR